MSRGDEARYGRMCLLVLNVCPFTLRYVIDDYSLRHGSLSLCDFLEKNKHSLFHLCAKTCCCGHQYRSTPMYKSQWDQLFMQNTSSCLNGKRIDCPCKYDSKPGLTTNVMDVTMCCLVINNLCPGVDAIHIKTIREIRNELIHAESARLDIQTYNGYLNRIKTAICQLAKNVSATLHTDTLTMICELENRLMDPVELGELRNLIIDEKRFTDLEMFQDVSNIADDLNQILAQISTEKMTQIEDQTQRELSQMRGTVDKRSMRENMKGFLKEGIITVPHSRGVLIGCLGAGKTTLLKRLQGKDKQAIEETESTRGLEVHFHAFEIKDGRLEVCVNDMQQHQFLGISTAELKPKEEQQKFDISPEASNPTGFSSLKSQGLRFFERKHEIKKEKQMATGRISDDQIENILTEKEKTFKITMVDIAGQLAYYACHQTYFTSKAFYIFVLDMTKPFDEIVEKEKTDSFFSTWTYGDYLKFWIDSIKTFGNKKAPVFLVASHAEEKTDDEINEYFEDVFNLVPEDKAWLEKTVGGKTYAFALKDFSDDKTKKQLDFLKQEMVQVIQTEIGSSLKVRASWALIEDVLRKSKKKIASRSEIWQIEETIGSDYHFADDDEMTNFLSFFHDHGFLLYFDEAHLREHVILDIQWFVNAFSIIIADKTHFLHDNSERNEVKEQWKKFDETGVLPIELLKALWENDETILRHQNIVLSYMEKLRMIAAIDGKWYVPCMNKRQEKAQMHELDENSNHTILRREYAIFPYFRLIAHNISILKWPVPFDKQASRQLFQTVTFFEYKHCSFAVRVREDEIQVVFREDISCKAQEKIVKALNEALVLITNTFYTHDSESYSSASKGKKAETSHKSEAADNVVKPSIKRPKTETGFETDVLGEDHTEILKMLEEANKDYTGVHLSLYRDSKDNAVIIGYNTTMSMNKIEIPEKYNGRLRIKNPRNVNDEALIASQYALENRIKLDHQQQDVLQSCIARYSSQLWENHSNLTMISGDCIKYTGGFPTERFCVVLYCLSKGFRPFKEDLFPTSLQEKGQDIPVDVREGYFLFGPIDLVGRVSQWNDPVCMGSSIGNKRDYKTGSVGLFVDLPNNLMGFITCCHVLFDCIRMVSLDKCYKEPDRRKKEDDAYFTVQPSLPSFCGIDKDERICGFVERAVFKPESAPVSVDAALVRITSRIPKTGHFTIRDNTQIKEAVYSPKQPPLYNGGKILCQIQSEEREKPLIKSGTTTGLTKGEFKMNGLEVSIPEDGAFLGDSAVYSPKRAMKGQYEIRSSMTFFDLGDSGSAVFLKNPDGSLKCVGMAIGRTSYYTTVVTPIGAILQALGLQEKDVTNFGEPMDFG